MEPVESRDEESLRGFYVSLGTYLAVFVLKLAVFFLTGFMTLFAEALHSLSDIFITALLFVAATRSRRRADATYMFGYGRAQNIGALIAATLFISFTSYKLYEEAIPQFFQGEPGDYTNPGLALGVLGGLIALSLVPLVTLKYRRRRVLQPALSSWRSLMTR